MRGNDFLARLGGDEFTAIIHHPRDSKIAEKLAQRILKEFRKPFVINNSVVNSTISIGMARYPLDGKSADELFNFADRALYAVKKAGGNNYSFSVGAEKVEEGGTL